MRSAILRGCHWTFALIFSALMCLPLASLVQHPRVTIGLKALVAAVALVSVAWPHAAVVGLAVLLPLALPIEHFLGPVPDATAITEAIVLAFAAGNFLYVAMSDLIPDLHRGGVEGGPFRQLLLIGAGILTIVVL